MKYLLLLALLVAVFWMWSKRARDRLDIDESKTPAPLPEKMVVCAHCGVYLPEGEALIDNAGKTYCCEAHRSIARGAG